MYSNGPGWTWAAAAGWPPSTDVPLPTDMPPSFLRRGDQVDDGEDHDPHHVDEVPVEADQLHLERVRRRDLAHAGQLEEREQHEDADGHVRTVEARQHEEGRAEGARLDREALLEELRELVDLAPD